LKAPNDTPVQSIAMNITGVAMTGGETNDSEDVMTDERFDRLRESVSEAVVQCDFADMEGLTKSEADELKDAFSLFDKDGSGTICMTELGSVMRAVGQNPTQQELEDIMNKADLDKSGSLTYDEYLNIINSYSLGKSDVEIQLRQAFLVFDRDKTGFLNRKELQEVLCGMGEPLSLNETEYVMSKIDTDKDGQIDVDEFVAFLIGRV